MTNETPNPDAAAFEEELQQRIGIESTLISKAWEDEDFKAELLQDPKGVFEREFEADIPDSINVTVYEETADNLYLVLPMKPSTEGELSDQELEAVAGGKIRIRTGNWSIGYCR
ncbi:MAG: NHLP leader peptide family natural product precursor [Moorea sp. SIO2B7]|nr:NHLP leader peptide family natural product precursor [Moorena sp. SIO2B7]